MLTQELINTFYSFSDVCRHLNYPLNGTGTRQAKRDCEPFNISHFGQRPWQQKYQTIQKECPVCLNTFETQKDHPREKMTCSYACSNTHFRTGEDHPNWKPSKDRTKRLTSTPYRKKALKNLPHKCNNCGWDKALDILHVHHKDRDRSNSNLDNLEILCPTCHDYEHYSNKDGRFSYL